MMLSKIHYLCTICLKKNEFEQFVFKAKLYLHFKIKKLHTSKTNTMEILLENKVFHYFYQNFL